MYVLSKIHQLLSCGCCFYKTSQKNANFSQLVVQVVALFRIGKKKVLTYSSI